RQALLSESGAEVRYLPTGIAVADCSDEFVTAQQATSNLRRMCSLLICAIHHCCTTRTTVMLSILAISGCTLLIAVPAYLCVRLRRSAQHLKASLREWGKICVEQQGKLDLVLTDLVMAGQDGHRLASELAEKYPAISVLFMSGCTDDSASRRDILLEGSP